MIQGDWETALEEIAWSLLEWDSAESLSGRSVVSSELNWPGLIGIVSSSSILKRNGQPAGWGESHDTTDQGLVRVTVDEFLWRPSTTENILPCGELDSRVTTCSDETKSGLLGKILPEIRESEDLFEENVVFLSSLWPLIEIVHDLGTTLNVLRWSKLKELNKNVSQVENVNQILTIKRPVDMAYIPLFQFMYIEL